MTPEAYDDLKEAYRLAEQVRWTPSAERDALLEVACAGDPRLRACVEALLRGDVDTGWLHLPFGGLVPERIGRYRIEGVVGSGAFGVVFKARQEQQPTPFVAIKVLLPGGGAARTRERFEREIELTGTLCHPGIARVLEGGRAEIEGFGERPYLVMELVEGLPITRWAKRQGLSPRARSRLVARAGEALQYAHERGVLHRDIKPSNILVREEGEPVLIDFGMARAFGEHNDSALTRTGDLIGTLRYMSPEQVAGHPRTVDRRSDVWGLGAVAYELFTGSPPFVADGSEFVLARRILSENAPRASSLDSALAGDLDMILARALAHEPSDRYSSAAEFCRDLESYARGQPVRGQRSVDLRFTRRNRVSAAAVAVALAGVFVWMTWPGRSSSLAIGAEKRQILSRNEPSLTSPGPSISHDCEVRPGVLVVRRNELRERLTERPDDTGLQSELALANLNLAGSYLTSQSVTAQLLLEEAMFLWEGMPPSRTKDVEHRRAKNRTLVHLGDVRKEIGDHKEALSIYEEALCEDEALTRDFPRNARVWDDLSWSYERVGGTHLALGFPEAAYTLFLKRLHIAEDLLTWDPERHKARYNYSWALLQLGELATALEQTELALPLYESATQSIDLLALECPDNAVYQQAMRAMRARNEDIKISLGLATPAREMPESIEDLEALMLSASGDAVSIDRVMFSLWRSLKWAKDIGDPQAVRRTLEEQVQFFPFLVLGFPDHIRVRRSFAGSLFVLAMDDAVGQSDRRLYAERARMEFEVLCESEGVVESDYRKLGNLLSLYYGDEETALSWLRMGLDHFSPDPPQLLSTYARLQAEHAVGGPTEVSPKAGK